MNRKTNGSGRGRHRTLPAWMNSTQGPYRRTTNGRSRGRHRTYPAWMNSTAEPDERTGRGYHMVPTTIELLSDSEDDEITRTSCVQSNNQTTSIHTTIELLSDSDDDSIEDQKEKDVERLGKEKAAMTETNLGKAILFVERFNHAINACEAVDHVSSENDMVILTERLMTKQYLFKKKGYCNIVDMGFHYTTKENLKHIRKHGLMSKKERANQGIKSFRNNGSVYGDGIYTGNNVNTFSDFGSVGIIVARLIGNFVKVTNYPKAFYNSQDVEKATTVIGNKKSTLMKWPESVRDDEVVLKEASQCLPLVQFSRHTNLDCITAKIQNLLNEYFNKPLHIETYTAPSTLETTKPRALKTRFQMIPSHGIGGITHILGSSPLKRKTRKDNHRQSTSYSTAPGVPIASQRLFTTSAAETRRRSRLLTHKGS